MNTSSETYQKLDRAALWLLVGEFGVAALLLVFVLLMIVGNLISFGAFDWDYGTGEAIALGIAIIYGLAYLGNLGIGIMGLYLYTIEKREGYPGTGHLTNWILLSGTLAFALFGIAVVMTSM